MNTFTSDLAALLGIFVIILTLLLQGLIAAFVKAKQPGAVPGKIPENLSHDSLVFRTHRTFLNSLENTPIMLATAFLALFSGVGGIWLAVCVWVYAVSRVLHMVLYYAISTEQNPSPRSWFYLTGLLANIALLVIIGWRLL